MPVTPFHIGIAVVAKAAAPVQFSFGVFAIVQAAIDAETVWNIAAGRYPIHAWAHTLAGSLLVAAVVLAPAKFGLTRLYAWLRVRLDGSDIPRWLTGPLGPVTWTAALTGAVFGAVSHVALDAILHRDVQPFMPCSARNPWAVEGASLRLHPGCVAAGALGVLFLRWRRAAR